MPVVNGNTGEFYALTTDEAVTMVQEVAGLVAGRAPLLAGVGRGIRDAQRLARASADAGAAALMVHQPPIPSWHRVVLSITSRPWPMRRAGCR